MTQLEDTNHILGILSSLLSRLGPDTPGRIRLLAKFVESDHEKVDKLLEIRDNEKSLLKKADKEIAVERKVSSLLFLSRLRALADLA